MKTYYNPDILEDMQELEKIIRAGKIVIFPELIKEYPGHFRVIPFPPNGKLSDIIYGGDYIPIVIKGYEELKLMRKKENEQELPEMITLLEKVDVKERIVQALSIPGNHLVEVPIERYEPFGNDKYWRIKEKEPTS